MTARHFFQFIRTKEPTAATEAVAQRLTDELTDGKRVLWIISGGSNIPLVVRIMEQLPDAILPRLAIMLADERYGEYNHPDSNMRQLHDAGFQARGATIVSALAPQGGTLNQAAEQYDKLVDFMLDHTHVTIAQLGMGTDGHIAGILPRSTAIRSKKAAIGYTGVPFQRITMTAASLKRSTAVYVVAYGDTKRQQLEALQHKHPVADQPAQLLKQCSEVYIYNDQIGERP